MNKPLWFLLIEQWKLKGMGERGITLPFLVGALANIHARKPSIQAVHELLQEMITKPFIGYVTEVRWCGDVNAPIFSVSKLGPEQMPFVSHFCSQMGEISLGFSQDLQSMFGLNCNGSNDCLEKLVSLCSEPIESARYSRIRNPVTRKWEFGDFQPRESQYINEIASLAEKLET